MAYIGQIELTKKKPPRVSGDERAWQDIYDTVNHLIDSVNSKSTTEQRRPGDLHNSVGDLKVFKDKTDNKYYMETMTEDGSARREMFISDKDNRTGKGYYTVSSAAAGGGSAGSSDSRNIEQQLFEQIPWTGGTPNNTAVDADGKLVLDTVAGATVSNSSIVQTDLVGSGKTFSEKPNNTAVDGSGNIVLDSVTGATVSNNNIVSANLIGGGKAFVTKPPVTFRQAGIPTALTVGDLWYDTDDGNKLYMALAVGADQITAGEWVATVDATIATAQSTADSKSKTFYQDDPPSSGISANDVWYDTNAGNKRYVYSSSNWVAAADTTYDQSTSITAAQNTADGRTSSFYATSAPTATAVGDIWFKTDSNMAMYRASATGSGNWVSTTPDFDVNTTTIVGNTVTTGFVNALNVNAATVAASWVYAGTLTAGQINAQSANITGLNAGNITTGTLSAAEINMSSGKARIETSGKITTQHLVECFSNSIGGERQGLRLIKHGDTSVGNTNWWQLFNDDSAENLVFNHGGSNVCELTTAGLMIGDEGIGFNTSGYNMQYDSGHIQVNLNGTSTNGLSIYPNYHSTGTTVGHDLGKSTKKWRKIFVVQSNVGDLRMSNDGDADWTLREKPDCILARNSKTQKTFKLNMTETSEYDSEEWDEND